MNGLNAFERQYRTTGAGAMTAQSVPDILSHHMKLSVEGMYLNIYVPKLQRGQGIVWFFRGYRGQPVPSAAVMSPMSPALRYEARIGVRPGGLDHGCSQPRVSG